MSQRKYFLKVILPILCVVVALGAAIGLYLLLSPKKSAPQLAPPEKKPVVNLGKVDEIGGKFDMTFENDHYVLNHAKVNNLVDLQIPETYREYPVTIIGPAAFKDHTEIEKLETKQNIAEIGDIAFYGCSSLVDVKFEQFPMIKKVDFYSGTFKGCPVETLTIDSGDNVFCIGENSSLRQVTLGPNVTSIDGYAFGGCTNLQTINIPDGITTIEGGTFQYCSSLEELKIPNSVTSIGAEAFCKCSNLQSINIPFGVTTIKYNLFSGCANLQEIIIPGSVETIEDWTFDGCSSLVSVTIPKSVTSIGFYGVFANCPSLASIVVEDGNKNYKASGNCLIKIDSKQMISGCKNSVLPTDGSVEQIMWYAFEGCTGLTSITIPKSVRRIHPEAFWNCSGLESIEVEEGSSHFVARNNCLIDINWHELVVGCKTSVIPLDGSVTSIDHDAFYGCSGLTSITIPSSVKTIRNDAFYNCTNLSEVFFQNGIETIENSAFANTAITSLHLPASVSSVGCAFNGCQNLQTIMVAGGNAVYHSSGNCLIETESKKLVFGCNNSVIPTDGSVSEIGINAFYCCDTLTSVTIPQSILRIDESVFIVCANLTEVIFASGINWNWMNIDKNAFGFSDEERKFIVHVPDAATGEKAREKLLNLSCKKTIQIIID